MNNETLNKLVNFITEEIFNPEIIWDIEETEDGFNLIFNKKDETVPSPLERIRKTEELMNVTLKTQVFIRGVLTYMFKWN